MKKISIRSGWRARVLRLMSAVCMMLAVGVLVRESLALDNFWTRGAGSLDWNVDGNWSQDFVPQATPFEEEGVIENGDTVFLSSVPVDPAGIILGRTASTFGGLEIRSGGSINVIDSTGTPNGTVSVGVDGTGSLEIQPGGMMSAQFLNVNGQSSLTVGGVGSPALLQVAGGVNLGGTTRVTGTGHTVSGQTVSFGGGGTLFADIRAASHSPVRATSTATLGGNFVLELGGGFTPTLGSTWNIVDAASIVGQFANVDLSAAPATGPGEVIRLATVPGGMHGQVLQLQYTSVLTLNVNWDNKAVSISSPSGQAINIDGYSILSASGGLESATWNSLQDQGLSGWQEATPSATALNELNTNVGGSLSVNATPRALGTPFDPVIGAFGQSPEDLVFEYTTSSGQIVQGLVNYTGNRIVNNLLLTVDPSTGAAQLKNSSTTTLQLDGYSVLSASGSLLPTNGNWLSLEDQGTSGWEESNPTPEMLSELLTDGFLTLNPGQFVNLGNLFDEVSGARDLALEFTLPGEADGLTGTVIYGALQAAVAGDYNGNGVVDAADYTIWRDTLGSTTDLRANGDNTGASANKVDAADYAFWKARFGNTSGTGAGGVNGAAVPEPSAWLLVGMACWLLKIARANRPEQGV